MKAAAVIVEGNDHDLFAAAARVDVLAAAHTTKPQHLWLGVGGPVAGADAGHAEASGRLVGGAVEVVDLHAVIAPRAVATAVLEGHVALEGVLADVQVGARVVERRAAARAHAAQGDLVAEAELLELGIVELCGEGGSEEGMGMVRNEQKK